MNTQTMSPNTRPSLLIRIRDPQDRAAWSEFTKLYEPVLRRVVRTLGGMQEADIDELVQEVLMTIMKSISNFELASRTGSFRRWLATIVQRKRLDHFKRKRSLDHRWAAFVERNAAHDLGYARAEEVDQLDLQLQEQLEYQLFVRAVHSVRSSVQPSTWFAFWRTAVELVPAQQVANEFGISVGQVYVARSRVLAKLRQFVAEQRANEDEDAKP